MVIVRLATKDDAVRIRSIVKHSSVAPTFFLDGLTSDAFSKVRDIHRMMEHGQFYLWDGGVFVCIPQSAWVDIHVAVLPEFRGSKAVQAAEFVAHRLFTRTPCEMIIGMIPLDNKPSAAFAREIGMQEVRVLGERKIYSLPFLRWVATRVDPMAALRLCEEHGFGFKTKAARQILEWSEVVTGANLKEGA